MTVTVPCVRVCACTDLSWSLSPAPLCYRHTSNIQQVSSRAHRRLPDSRTDTITFSRRMENWKTIPRSVSLSFYPSQPLVSICFSSLCSLCHDLFFMFLSIMDEEMTFVRFSHPVNLLHKRAGPSIVKYGGNKLRLCNNILIWDPVCLQ